MGWVFNATPRQLYPQERPGAHCIGGWVGPRAVWKGAESLDPLRFDPRNVQSVASRYTDCTVMYLHYVLCVLRQAPAIKTLRRSG
jgi:hypothetical protein